MSKNRVGSRALSGIYSDVQNRIKKAQQTMRYVHTYKLFIQLQAYHMR